MPVRVLSAVVLAATVAACTTLASKGTIPPADANGDINLDAAPAFIAVVGSDGTVVGYVRKELVLGDGDAEDWPVFADDLVTLVGHMVPGRGYVPLNVDPNNVPLRPVQQGPSFAP